MGIKSWLGNKAIEAQEAGGNNLARDIDKLLDSTLEKKVEGLRKKGKEITEESLISGWKGLKVIGVTEEQIRRKAKNILTSKEKQ